MVDRGFTVVVWSILGLVCLYLDNTPGFYMFSGGVIVLISEDISEWIQKKVI